MIGIDWPASATWAVGTFVGIDLVFDGWSLVMAGVAHEVGGRPTRHLRLVPRRAAAWAASPCVVSLGPPPHCASLARILSALKRDCSVDGFIPRCAAVPPP